MSNDEVSDHGATKFQRVYATALTTYIGTLAFFSPSESHFLYYFLSLISFVLLGLLVCKGKVDGVFSTLYQTHRWLFWTLLLWFGFSTVSLVLVWLDASTENLQRVLGFIRHLYDVTLVGFVFVLARLQAINILKVENLFFALVAGFALMVGLEIIIYHQIPISSQHWFEGPPLGLHVRDQGNLACVISVSIAAFWAVKPPSNFFQKSFLFFAMWLGFSFVYWSGGRTAIFSTLLTLLIILSFVFYTKQPHRWAFLALLIVLISLGVFTAESFSVYPWNGISRAMGDTQRVSDVASDVAISQSTINQMNINELTTGRAKMWEISLNALRESPWLGLGPYGYFFIPERFFGDQPHNFLIQFLVEWGVLGASCMLLLMLVYFVFVLKNIPRAYRISDYRWVMAAAVICVLTLHGLTGGTYFMAQPLTFLSIAYSVALSRILKVR